MTEDDLRQFLHDERESITAAVKARAIERLTESMRWTMPETISAVVGEFINAEVVPAVKAHLQEQKGPLVAAAIKASSEIGDAIAKQITATAVKTLANDYRASEVLKALFGLR